MSDRSWLSSLFSSRGEQRFELVVLEGAEAGRRFPLRYDRMLIGRRAADPNQPQEICLSDRSVSVRQATIEIKRGRVFIEHLPGATNPTVVNRRRVTRTKLRHGDIIVLGLVVLELREIPETARAEPRAAAAEPAATRRAAGDRELGRRPPDAAIPAAEAKTWWDAKPQAEAGEATTDSWSSPRTATETVPEDLAETVISDSAEAKPETDAEPTAAGPHAEPLREDEMKTIVRPPPETAAPVPEDLAETVIADSVEAKPETDAEPTAAGPHDEPLRKDEMQTIVQPPPEMDTPEPKSQAETIIIDSADGKPEP